MAGLLLAVAVLRAARVKFMVSVRWFPWRKPAEPPLTGGRPRLKTYSAQNGYVYTYRFAGQRARESAVEYVFDVARDRSTRFQASVLVADSATRPWRDANRRELIAGEQYAIAKIALQRFLDVCEAVGASVEIAPTSREVSDILDSLGA